MRKATENLSVHGISIDEGATFELEVTLTVGNRSVALSANQAQQLLDASVATRKSKARRKPKTSAKASGRSTGNKRKSSVNKRKSNSRNDKVLALVDGNKNFTARVVVSEMARNGRAVLAEAGETLQVGHNKNGYWYGTNARTGHVTSERSIRSIVNRSEVTGIRQ